MMKINVDAAISKNVGKATAAAIVRDEAGVFQGASVLVISGLLNPETMEAVACREGLALAADLGLRRFRMASDCLSVVKTIQRSGLGAYGHVVMEIKARAAAFECSEIMHESRTTNTDAHCLTRRFKVSKAMVVNDIVEATEIKQRSDASLSSESDA
ncbi:hypothetical protein EJB05_35982, partial [Eragrostis curvula]